MHPPLPLPLGRRKVHVLQRLARSNTGREGVFRSRGSHAGVQAEKRPGHGIQMLAVCRVPVGTPRGNHIHRRYRFGRRIGSARRKRHAYDVTIRRKD